MQPGGTEIILIVLVLQLLFGEKMITELMHRLGSGLREFRKASRETVDVDIKADNVVNNKSLNPSSN